MTSINLLPWREERREKNRRLFMIGLGFSAGLALVVVVTTFMVFNNLIEHQRERNRLIEDEIARYNWEIREIKKLKSTKDALVARMNVIQRLQESRPEIVHFFDELVKVMPRSIYLLKIERYGDGIMLTGHTDSNSSVSLLMQNIRKNYWLNKPILEEVAEVTNNKKTKLYNQFRLKITLKPKNKLQLGEAIYE